MQMQNGAFNRCAPALKPLVDLRAWKTNLTLSERIQFKRRWLQSALNAKRLFILVSLCLLFWFNSEPLLKMHSQLYFDMINDFHGNHGKRWFVYTGVDKTYLNI